MTIAASSAVYKSTSHSDLDKFSLIVRLPDENLLRVKSIRDGSTLLRVKKRLELLSGCPASTYKLQNINGKILEDETILRVGDNVSDNTVMSVSLLTPYGSVYDSLSQRACSASDIASTIGPDSSRDITANILFMCSYHGNLDLCKYLLANEGVLVAATTCSGNSCLHAAAAKDHLEVALELCRFGADIHAKNRNGSTPLDVALEFGSFTLERQLRLSQWTRRKEMLTKVTENPQKFSQSSTNTKLQHVQSAHDASVRERREDNSFDRHEVPSPANHLCRDTVDTAGAIRPSTASHLYERPSTVGSTKQRMTAVNHAMPPSSKAKSKERRARVRSAPLLNSETRNERLCKLQSNEPNAVAETGKNKNKFRLTKPQYLQYIKSSTGIVEEDYFADIFPEQEKPQATRSFDDQMKRNERIFKKMFKESGVLKECSDTDSEEELARQHANKKAVKRWCKKQDQQKLEERKKLSISAYPSRKTGNEHLGELLLIGDTSRGDLPETDSKNYIRAYQTYKENSGNIKSCGISLLDPVSYEQWVETKPNQPVVKKKDKSVDHTSQLVRKIDYNTWLASASKRINMRKKQERAEEKQKEEFETWIEELKDEVGTYDYWRRCKDEQIAKQREIKRKQREEEQRKQSENEKRRQLAKDIYKHWAINKEKSKLQQEENKLLKERERLEKLRSGRP